jgi:hypothetical protein
MLFIIILDSEEELKRPFLTTIAPGFTVKVAKGTYFCFTDHGSCKGIKEGLEKMKPLMPSLRHFYVFRLQNFDWNGVPHTPDIAQRIEEARLGNGEIPEPKSF